VVARGAVAPAVEATEDPAAEAAEDLATEDPVAVDPALAVAPRAAPLGALADDVTPAVVVPSTVA
jgi:hypothetical protein